MNVKPDFAPIELWLLALYAVIGFGWGHSQEPGS